MKNKRETVVKNS